MAIFIPDLFTGYINGREAAIKANWSDQENYNNVLKGQLQNAYDMQTFDDAAAIARNNRINSDANAARYGLETDLDIQRGMAALQNGIPQLQGQVSRMALETRRAELQREMDLIDGQLSRIPPGQGQGAQVQLDPNSVRYVDTADAVQRGTKAMQDGTSSITPSTPNSGTPAQAGDAKQVKINGLNGTAINYDNLRRNG